MATLFRCYFETLFTTKCFRQIHQGDSGAVGGWGGQRELRGSMAVGAVSDDVESERYESE